MQLYLKQKRWLLLVLLLVFLMPLASATINVNNEQFYVAGQPLQYVSFQSAQVIDVRLNISADESFEVVGDLRALNQDPTKQSLYKAFPFSCRDVDDNTTELVEYICTAVNVLLIPQVQDELFITLNFTTENGWQTQNFTYGLEFDDTRPEITTFKTEFCGGDTCYVASGQPTEITIDIQDTKATFYQEKIFFSIDNQQARRIFSCEDMTCSGVYTVTSCESGMPIKAEITSAGGIFSSDDAGNPLKGKLRTSFICDVDTPGEKNIPDKTTGIEITTEVQGAGVFPNPKEGDTVSIIATISEDASGVTGTVNASKLTGNNEALTTTCTANPGGQSYTCEWTVSNIDAGNSQLDFIFVDGVGREKEYTWEMQVDEFIRANDQEATPAFFSDITAKPIASNGFNRLALAMAYDNGLAYPLAVTFDMRKKAGTGKVEALYTYIDERDKYFCKLYDDGRLLDIKGASVFNFAIVDTQQPYTETNRIDLQLLVDPNDINDSITMKCNVSVMVRVDENKVYESPTEFEITIPLEFRNSRLGDEAPGEKYANAIKDFEEDTKTFNNIIKVLDSVYATMRDLCNLQQMGNSVGRTGVGMQLAGSLINQFFGGSNVGGQVLNAVAPVMAQAGQQTGTYMYKQGANFKDFSKSINYDTDLNLGQSQRGDWAKDNLPGSFNLQEIFSQSCQWVSCSVADVSREEEKAQSWYFSGDYPAKDFVSQYSNLPDGSGMGNDILGDIFSDVDLPDVKESIYAAVQARCLPAIVYHLNNYRQMNCQTLTCMKINARYGTDISICNQAKAQFVCEAVLSEAMELPGIRQASSVVDNTNEWIQNLIPNSLKLLADNSICKGAVGKLSDDFVDNAILPDGRISPRTTFLLATCALPEVIGNQLNMIQKSTPSKELFTYPVNVDNSCAFAYCNKEDINECQGDAPSYIQRYLGISIPTSTLNTFQSQLYRTGSSTNPYYLNTQQNPNLPGQINDPGLRKLLSQGGMPTDYVPPTQQTTSTSSTTNTGGEQPLEVEDWMTEPFDISQESSWDDLVAQADQLVAGFEAKIQSIEKEKAEYTTKLNSYQTELAELQSQIQTKESEVTSLVSESNELFNYANDLALSNKPIAGGNGKIVMRLGGERKVFEFDKGSTQGDVLLDATRFIEFTLGTDPAPGAISWTEFNYKQGAKDPLIADYLQSYYEAEKKYDALVGDDGTIIKAQNQFLAIKNDYDQMNDLTNTLQSSINSYNQQIQDLQNDLEEARNLPYQYPEDPRTFEEIWADNWEEYKEKTDQMVENLVKVEPDTIDPFYTGTSSTPAGYNNPNSPLMRQLEGYIEQMREDKQAVEQGITVFRNAEGSCKGDPACIAQARTNLANCGGNQNCIDREQRKIGGCNLNAFDEQCTAEADSYADMGENALAEIDGEINRYRNPDGTVNIDAFRNLQRQQLDMKRQNIYRVVDVLAGIALQNGFLNWASLTSYGHNTTLGRISDWSDTWLNSDNYKESICSANFIIPKDETAQQGSAQQCIDGLCRPVLSQAAERIPLNDTHYVYTAVYFVGNLQTPSFVQLQNQETVKFNIFFEDGSTSKKLFDIPWFEVGYNQITGDTIAFVSTKEYDRICIHFEFPYPPDEQGKKDKYCRDIKDAGEGQTDFDTGAPVPADYLDPISNTATTPGSATLNTDI